MRSASERFKMRGMEEAWRAGTGAGFLARCCEWCPVCRHARATQRGWCYDLVRKVERGLCPFGRAYERVHGRKPYEPMPADGSKAK